MQVLLIAVVTATVWFSVTYASPCKAMPSPDAVDLLKVKTLPSGQSTLDVNC